MSSSSPTPALIICMGTSGCGKSSIGLAVAQSLGVPFVDGDDLHPLSNVAKMSSGTPLTDEDRIPWLRTIRHTAIELTSPAGVAAVASSSNSGSSTDTDDPPALTKALQHVHPATKGLGDKTTSRPRAAVVIGCSALRRPYRQLLSGKHAVMRDGLEEPASDNQGLETYFLYLHGTRALLLARMNNRPGHFFKPAMLDSQLATLERPTEEEGNVGTVLLGKGDGEAEEVGMEGVIELASEVAKKWVG